MTNRLPDWDRRLNQTLEACRDRPFVWGRHDCCHFAGACVEAMTGTNPLRERYGSYSNEQEARDILKRQGKGTLYRTLVHLFGKPRLPHQARRGDIVFTVQERRPSVGVCLGAASVFVGEFAGKPGLVTIPTLQTLRAFWI